MSSFLKRSKRKAGKLERKKVQNHIKGMYKIMAEIKEVAKEIHESGRSWTEDTIEEVAASFTDRPIQNMEKFLLMGNLKSLEDGVQVSDD